MTIGNGETAHVIVESTGQDGKLDIEVYNVLHGGVPDRLGVELVTLCIVDGMTDAWLKSKKKGTVEKKIKHYKTRKSIKFDADFTYLRIRGRWYYYVGTDKLGIPHIVDLAKLYAGENVDYIPYC